MKIKYVRSNKSPASGDLKVVQGRFFIRRQRYSKREKAYLVRDGRPQWEWIEIDAFQLV